MWDRVRFSNPTFLKSLDLPQSNIFEVIGLPQSNIFEVIRLPQSTTSHTHQCNEAFKAVLFFIAFPFSFLKWNHCFLDLLVLTFFSMAVAVINQLKKNPYTIVHCTVGKVGSKREAENKTAPLSIFCHLLPWDIIMHRQWRRKTIICQVLCTTTIHTYLQAMYNSTSNEFLFRNNGGVTYCHQEGCIVPWFCQPNLFCCLEMKYYKVASSRLSQ